MSKIFQLPTGFSREEHEAEVSSTENVGEYLRNMRLERELTQKEVCDLLDISTNYLSEIERGNKVPSDVLIREIAAVYGVDEDIIFSVIGRVPLYAIEELSDSTDLQQVLSRIRKDGILKDEERYHFYEVMLKTYERFVREAERKNREGN